MGRTGRAAAGPDETSDGRTSVTGWIAFLAHFLFVLAAWTVVIKYLFPIAFALGRGEPWTAYVFWDFWPVAHVWLGWALLRRPRYTRPLALGMSVLEILIILSLFASFLSDPEWTIWRMNWFINKIFVLACFILILGTAAFNFDRLAPEKKSTTPNVHPQKEKTT